MLVGQLTLRDNIPATMTLHASECTMSSRFLEVCT